MKMLHVAIGPDDAARHALMPGHPDRSAKIAAFLMARRSLRSTGNTRRTSDTERRIRDSVTGMFSPTGSLAGPRSSHTATLLADGRVLVVGGRGVDAPLASAELWEPSSSSTTE